MLTVYNLLRSTYHFYQSFQIEDVLQEDLKFIKEYDSTRNIGIEELIEAWNRTFEFRIKTMKRETNLDILKEWPILQHPEAYRLVMFERYLSDIFILRLKLLGYLIANNQPLTTFNILICGRSKSMSSMKKAIFQTLPSLPPSRENV